MNPRYAPFIVLGSIVAIVAVVSLSAPLAIVALGAMPIWMLLADVDGRRNLLRRLRWIAPVALVALGIRWFGHAAYKDLMLPALRIVAAVAWSTWLTHTMPPGELEAALHVLHFPASFVALLGQTRRFGMQLFDTLAEAWNAAVLRAGLHSGRATLHTAGYVAGVLLVRALDRAERVAVAASLRGSELDLPTPRGIVTGAQPVEWS